MSKMLGRDIDPVKRAQLLNMTLHPGYAVLRDMMDEACHDYTVDVIKLNPVNTENYREKLANLQMMARCVNDFCASLVKSIEAHNRVGAVERVNEEAVQNALNTVEYLRKEQEKDNTNAV